jgi:hypothetical protein
MFLSEGWNHLPGKARQRRRPGQRVQAREMQGEIESCRKLDRKASDEQNDLWVARDFGEMAERLKAPVSKTG